MRCSMTSSEDGADTTFAAESLRLEALDEDGARRQHEPEVIEVEDRAEGSAALAGLW